MTTNNEATAEKKTSILKSLAVVGFISIIILLAWLSVQAVRVAPSAFSSLASLAESIYQRQATPTETEIGTSPLIVTSSLKTVDAGKPIEINWGETKTPGSFTFSYACAEGVAIDINNVEGVRSIACDTNYNIGDVTSLSLTVDSEKARYADVSYTVSFLRTNDTSPYATGEASFSVVNIKIADLATKEDTTPATQPPTGTTETTSEAVTVTTDNTNIATVASAKKIPRPQTYEQEYVYTIPTSDPNGRVDLSPRFLGIGKIVSNTFFAGQAKAGEAGALQFEVKNYGTKTSDDWSFTISLPGGQTYESKTQSPLKPNERAVITIGYPATNQANHTFVVSTKSATDKNSINDQFSKLVSFN